MEDGRTSYSNKCPVKLKNKEQITKLNIDDDKLITLFKKCNTVIPTKSCNQASLSDTGRTDKYNVKNCLCSSQLQNESILKIKQDLINWISKLKNSEEQRNSLFASKLQNNDKTKRQDQTDFVIKRLDIVHTKHQRQRPQRLFTPSFIINVFSEFNIPGLRNTFRCSLSEQRIYRCEPISLQDGCCCSCTSDAMFEVMKGLYDCYKKKNCDNCDCILCGQYMVEIIDKSSDAAGEKVKKEGAAAVKEKAFKDLAMSGAALPEGNTTSEKELLQKLRAVLGLPPTPKTAEEKGKEKKAEAAGILLPLDGKSPTEKEFILKKQAELGLTLPEGRTPSEKSLVKKVKISTPVRKSLIGLLTPLEGKSPEQKENLLRRMAMANIPLPEGKTASEKKLVKQVRIDLGLPPGPKTAAERNNYIKAQAAGLITPLEEKLPAQKEAILKSLHAAGIPLPEGRTPSERDLIEKIQAKELKRTPSQKLQTAKAAGLLTPLQGKTSEQKEKILRGLALLSIPLPDVKTPSEKKLVSKVRNDVGLPPEPKTTAEKDNYNKAFANGIITPLEGKSPDQKEKILRALKAANIPLPAGRTPSEKSLIEKIKLETTPIPLADKLKKAKATGLLTPLEGKTPEQKENILRGLALSGLPLPQAKNASEEKLIAKVRTDLGLPPEPKTSRERDKYIKAMASGLITPLHGKPADQKEKILRNLNSAGIKLPVGRTPSEKSMIAKIKVGLTPRNTVASSQSADEKLKKAKAAGFLTPLSRKTPDQKSNILKGLAMSGLPLPEGTTPSEKKLIEKVRKDIGLPPEPKTSREKELYSKAIAAGIITPLEGKTPDIKEKILKAHKALGLPLAEGRTDSEKALVARVKGMTPVASQTGFSIPTDKLKMAKAAGLLTPLDGKSLAEKENILRKVALMGLPLPSAKTLSEKGMLDKIRKEVGLPPEPQSAADKEKYRKGMATGFVTPLEGKTRDQKEKNLRAMHAAGISLPEGRTPSEKSLIANINGGPASPLSKRASEKLRQAKAAGLLTPLAGKTTEEKENILRGLALQGLPLPDGTTSPEKKLIEKVRYDVGLPPTPKNTEDKRKYDQAFAAGVIKPLEGKTPEQKEKILRAQQALGIPLPEGRTDSEKELVEKVKLLGKLYLPTGVTIPINKLKDAKAAGLLTPLDGKTPKQKEIILRNIAMKGLPLPPGRTNSDRNLINKVRRDLGLPPAPQSAADKEKYNKAMAIGIITPLEGKSTPQKEKILTTLQAAGIQLPEGRTTSEKTLIANITKKPQEQVSDKLRKAKVAGLLTPLAGKTPTEKEKIIRGLAMQGLPLPDGSTPSEIKIIDKVINDLGLPPRPKTPLEKKRYNNGLAAGVITPLEGKTPELKEKILRAQHAFGIPLLEGRTSSERALVNKIKFPPPKSDILIPFEKLKTAKAAGLLTPLEGKAPAEKEKLLRKLASHGLPLPLGQTPSEKYIINKVRYDIGLPPEPLTAADKKKYDKAFAVGIIVPLEGKPLEVKEKILKGLLAAGIPLPEGRSPSETALVTKVGGPTEARVSDRLRRAKAAGLLYPLSGKTPEKKEKILRGLAMQGLPLPEGSTISDKQLIDKVRKDLGLPPIPTTTLEKKRYNTALNAGLIVPLEGKSPALKEKLLRAQKAIGIPLPEGRTRSERALIAKIKSAPPLSFSIAASEPKTSIGSLPEKPTTEKDRKLRAQQDAGTALPEETPITTRPGLLATFSDKIRKAKAAGFLTPLFGKSPTEKKNIIKGLANLGLPIPDGTTPSEKSFLRKTKAEFGIPPEARTPSEKAIIKKAKDKGFLTPLAGKSPEQKEQIIKGLAEAGLPLPEGRTLSDKRLIKKIRQEFALPSEPTPSEKLGKIRKKSKKLEPVTSKKSMRGLAATSTTENLNENTDATKCDRSCGCEKKKIKFKHSYLKIRVTSPDISPTCPCPDDCYPYPKPEVVTDNDGIKVTVGSAVGIPAFAENSFTQKSDSDNSDGTSNHQEAQIEKGTVIESTLLEPLDKKINYLLENNNYMTDSSNDEISNSSQNLYVNRNNSGDISYARYDLRIASDRREMKEDNSNSCLCETSSSQSVATKIPSRSSFKSIILIKTNASDSLLANVDVATVVSIISIVGSSYTSNLSSDFSSGHDIVHDGSDLSSSFSSGIIYSLSSNDLTTRYTKDYIANNLKVHATKNAPHYNRNEFIYRISQTGIPNIERSKQYIRASNNRASIFVTKDFDIKYTTMDVGSKTRLKRSLSEGSSVFLVLSTSDEFESDHSLNDTDNPICMRLAQVSRIRRPSNTDVTQASTSKEEKKSKKKKKEKKIKLSKSKSMSGSDSSKDAIKKKLKFESYAPTEYRVQRSVKLERSKIYRAVSVDTIQDRPCCCTPRKVDIGNSLCSALLSDIFTPLINDQDFNEEDQQNFRVTSTSVTSIHKTYYIAKKQSPMNLNVCYIPPCKRPKNSVEPPTPDEEVSCEEGAPCCPQPKPDPEKEKAKALQAELDKRAKELRPNWKEWKPGDPGEQTCESCGRPVDGKVKCLCSGKDEMKTIRKTLCPCSAYTETPKPPEVPPPEPVPVPDCTKKVCQCCVCEGGTAKKGVKCSCAENTCIAKRHEKERCDCYTEPIPETPIDYEILTDLIKEQKQIEMQNSLKLISEKTQMTSGFTIRMRKKPLAEMTLEEAIKYFELHPEEAPEPIPDIEDCLCEEVAATKRKPSWKARLSLIRKRGCYPPSPPELIEISPVRPRDHRPPGSPLGTYPDFDDFNPKGLKVAVEGKGSGSQGLKCLKNLKGVCIFDLLQDQTFPTTSKTPPDSPE